MFENFTFPHIKYLASRHRYNHNPDKVRKVCRLEEKTLRNQKFFGEEKNLTHGKIYEFHFASYSPNRETKYRDVLVTKDDNDKYIRYEDNKEIWK